MPSTDNCNSRDTNIVSGIGFMGFDCPGCNHGRHRENNEFLIPYSSGEQIILITPSGTENGQASAIGFGSTFNSLTITSSGQIITGQQNIAFLLPEKSILSDLNIYFTNTNPLSTSVTTQVIKAQVYISTTPDNTFTPLNDAVVTLQPQIIGSIIAGTSFLGQRNNLKIKLNENTRIMLVFSLNYVSGDNISLTVLGYSSAGMTLKDRC